MKSIFINIKNILPYLLLVTVYFFFVNIEARNDMTRNKIKRNIVEKINDEDKLKSDINYDNKRMAIPVIPYKQ